jgi:hypothetical protein
VTRAVNNHDPEFHALIPAWMANWGDWESGWFEIDLGGDPDPVRGGGKHRRLTLKEINGTILQSG